MSLNILVTALGSTGDVHPFIGLGQALRCRGHRVTLVSNGEFEALARSLGMDFVELEVVRAGLANRRRPFWAVPRARVESQIRSQMRRLYEIIQSRYVPGRTVVVAFILSIGARVAQEKLGVPLATVHVQPMLLRSVEQASRLPFLFMPDWMPVAGKRFQYWLADALYFDRVFASETNAFRADLGLPPVRRLFPNWLSSPQRVIGLFPEWFAPPQTDWPPQTRLTGFPLFEPPDQQEVPREVSEFLAGTDPPVVFTTASWMAPEHPSMRLARRFFEESVAACRLLGRRALLVTDRAELAPEPLPEWARRVARVPFSRILPRAAALVHHGGMGTGAQALAAGIPQLTMPMIVDQPDNAQRLERLGVSLTLGPRAYRASRVARSLRRLLGSTSVAERCRSLAERLRERAPLDQACAAIEELPGSR